MVERSEPEPNPSPPGWIVRAEEIFFAGVLLLMLVVGVLPILARRFDLGSFQWAGPLSKQCVLWIAMFGASAATRDRKHIRIDVISQFVPAMLKSILSAISHLVATGICAFLLYTSFQVVVAGESGPFGEETSQIFDLPQYVLAGVLPVGFLLLTIRFALAAYADSVSAWRGEPPQEAREE